MKTPDIYLIVTDENTARQLIRDKAVSHVISIGNPHSTPPAGLDTLQGFLRLEFDDVTHTLSPWSRYESVSPRHIRACAEFVEALPAGAHLVVHCAAGTSRSPAMAAVVLMVRCGWSEEAALAFVKGIRPQAIPNPLVLSSAQDYFRYRERRAKRAAAALDNQDGPG